ncbi:MAG: NADH-quinone oxidoreductase subunit C [Chloroflexota bacterium]
MTLSLSGVEVGDRLKQRLPQAIELADGCCLWLKREHFLGAAGWLKETLELDYLTNLTAADVGDHFEVTYHFTSVERNHSLMVKVQCPRQDAQVPSVVGLWCGADLQEREVYDLMGVSFPGHPRLKRVFLWESFEGHPLRKDYL